jgi:hypothetical protein
MSSAKFLREMLPPAFTFYETELGTLTSPRRGWRMGRCPFHPSKSGKSFSVHVDGGFFCHGCQSKGGDLIAFVRLRDHCDFASACKTLGCWVEDGKQPEPRLTVAVPYLVFDFIIDGKHYRSEVKDEPRTYREKIFRFYVDARDRLVELSRGDSEMYTGERETQWTRMALGFDELREIGDYE